jgi:hypothetical protein
MALQPKVIYWIRHAESCANLLENKIVDTYENAEFKTKHSDHFKQFASAPQNFDADATTNFLRIKDTSDLRDPQIRQIISKNIELINKNTAVCHKKIFTSGPESRWLFHPPLSATGILQAQKLHASAVFEGVVEECNVFITSATVRTIMTAIYSLLKYSKPITLYVVPCINEKLNEASCAGLDYVNTGIPVDKIDAIINYIVQYIDASKAVPSQTPHHHVIGNITINANFYFNNEFHPNNTTVDPDQLLKTNIETFKSKIIPQLSAETHIPIAEMAILAYSHGYVINDLLKLHGSDYAARTPYAPNVSMFMEKNNRMDVVIVDDRAPNGGVFVRKHSPSFLDYDIRVSNPCELAGFRGDVNKILHSSRAYMGGNLRKKSRGNKRNARKTLIKKRNSRSVKKQFKQRRRRSIR